MLPYHPALRFKRGEYLAAAKLPRDIQRRVEPYFIVPPPQERDPEKGETLTPDEIAYHTGERIGKHWPIHRAYLDAQYVLPAIQESGMKRMFQIARARNDKLVPVVTARQLHLPIWRTLLRSTRPRLAIHLPFGELDGDILTAGLRAVGCKADDCDIFIDFTGADLTPEIAADVVSGALDRLGEIAPWRRVVFQGSAFPAKNPTEEGKASALPRNEWFTFLRAMEDCGLPPERLGYSDFGPDCGEINFPRKDGGARPIPHTRYTSSRSTYVVRGASTGAFAEVMTDVFNRLIQSEHFAGQGYSYADRAMWEAAQGIGSCGNPSIWREWNMAHHMTRVIRDLGALAGVEFEIGADTTVSKQAPLFERDQSA